MSDQPNQFERRTWDPRNARPIPIHPSNQPKGDGGNPPFPSAQEADAAFDAAEGEGRR